MGGKEMFVQMSSKVKLGVADRAGEGRLHPAFKLEMAVEVGPLFELPVALWAGVLVLRLAGVLCQVLPKVLLQVEFLPAKITPAMRKADYFIEFQLEL
jgi:hypothetical protein